MRTDYLQNPIGLGNPSPRFYWQCQGGIGQTAYRIIAHKDGCKIWDSGKVSSAAMTHISYGGPEVESRERIDWKVCLWDENDEPGEWTETFFEMGLLLPEDWKAKWISGNYRPRKNTRYPVDCFRKEVLCESQVKKARLYITACGLYRAFVDHKPVSDSVFTPGVTDYRKRIQYQTYDVTMLFTGQNRTHFLEILLAGRMNIVPLSVSSGSGMFCWNQKRT